MSSIRERLKSAAQQGQNYTKLHIDLRLEVKQDEQGPHFTYYDKEKKEYVKIRKPITGILVGRCMFASWWDANVGKNGGTWVTGYYFAKSNVTLFQPSSMGYTLCTKGTFEEVEQHLVSKGVRSAGRKYQVLLVRMKTADGYKTVAVQTNISIAISQFKGVDRDKNFDYFVQLTPKQYSDGDIPFDKTVSSATVRLMNTNPPKYAFISWPKPLSDEEFVEYGAEAAINNFTKWSDEQKGVKEEVKVSSGEANVTHAEQEDYITGKIDGFKPPVADVVADEDTWGSDADDLPF